LASASGATRSRPCAPAAHKAAPHIEKYRGRDGFIHVPRELAPAIIGVFGLDNRNIAKRNYTGDPTSTVFLTAPKVAQLYDFPTNSAAGQTTAIVSFGGPNPPPGNGYDTTPGPTNDFARYYSSLAGYTAPNIITVPPAASVDNFGPDDETTQDICIAATVAC